MPCSAEGRYCAWGTRYWLPKSTNGIDPPAYLLNSAVSGGVGFSSTTCPNGELASSASPNHSTGVKARYLLVYPDPWNERVGVLG
jgi:hypothetical protein